MLGLDIGWNCYISLGNDPKPEQKQQQQHQKTKDNLKEDIQEKVSHRTSSSSNYKRSFNYRKKLNRSRSQKQKMFHQKKRLFNEHKNCSFTQSMPILKYSKPKKYLNVDGGADGGASDNTSLIALSSQIVKFDLSNLSVKRKQRFKKSKTIDRKLFRFESDEEEDEDDGEKDGNEVGQSSESSSDSELNFNIPNRQNKKRLSHMNSKTSMTSSYKCNQKLNSISVSSNKYQDDENSSHRTNHSGRTLSETEILGNAVNYLFFICFKYRL